MRAIGDDAPGIDRLAHDIFTKTGGLAKDIEYCLRQYTLELGRGARAGAIEGLLSTIDRLPLIHREFLIVAALLDGGVEIGIARNTVSRLAAAYDKASLDGAVENSSIGSTYVLTVRLATGCVRAMRGSSWRFGIGRRGSARRGPPLPCRRACCRPRGNGCSRQ